MRLISRSFFFAFVLLFSINSLSAQGLLTGKIVDAKTGNAVVKAKVEVPGMPVQIMDKTDEQGNFSISRTIALDKIKKISIALAAQNLFVLTKYTGANPEPVLADTGTFSNGTRSARFVPGPYTPGIDRRNNYLASRTVSLRALIEF